MDSPERRLGPEGEVMPGATPDPNLDSDETIPRAPVHSPGLFFKTYLMLIFFLTKSLNFKFQRLVPVFQIYTLNSQYTHRKLKNGFCMLSLKIL